jgi:3-keto-5-aminohexanoate cleavage enzyme
MEKLIITVTADSTVSFPNNPYGIESSNTKMLAEEYVRSVDVGAAIVHTHGSYTSDPEIQPDGRQLQIPILDGWRDITERILAKCKPILQFGLASMRKGQKLELWETLRPDMSSINFNSHDEYFQPDPAYPPISCYSVHPIPELREYARLAKERGVKLEIECFTTGAFWAIGKIREGDFWNADGTREREESLLADPLWLTLFLGWPGQGWTPPTVKGLQYMVDHLPPRANWSVSCMDVSVYWPIMAQVIAMGGHVRVGMEDCPFVEDGVYAETNAQLVEKAVRIAREIGREIASPAEARQITGLAH